MHREASKLPSHILQPHIPMCPSTVLLLQSSRFSGSDRSPLRPVVSVRSESRRYHTHNPLSGHRAVPDRPVEEAESPIRILPVSDSSQKEDRVPACSPAVSYAET